MQKKKKYKLLLTMLLLSSIILCCLIFVLKFNDKEPHIVENNESSVQVEYYLPSVIAKELVVSHGMKVTPEMFISSVESIYEVSFSYEKEPNLEKYGVQEVIILVTDAIGSFSSALFSKSTLPLSLSISIAPLTLSAKAATSYILSSIR